MTDETNTPPQASTNQHPASPKIPEHGGYWLISQLLASLVSLFVGLAWPATVLLLAFLLVHKAGAIKDFLNDFMKDKERVEVSAGGQGVLVKIVALQVQSGLSRQIAQTGPVSSDEVQRTADSAAAKLVPQTLRSKEAPVKVLWVDDHPENNIGLQYAFQALGIIVVCINSNDAISDAFTTAGGFDVVITDMFRDAILGKPDQPEAGLDTAKIIERTHPNVPVIIYAGRYSAQHAGDPVVTPIIANTNNTQRVFDLVSSIATAKIKLTSR